MSEKKKVLAVDDDPSIGNFVKVKLEKTGRFEVTATTDGRGAVLKAKELRPDLILLDIDMPAIGGNELAAALQKEPSTAGIPILFLSSLITRGDVQAAGGKIGGWP